MVDYGQNPQYLKRIDKVDYYPDIAGIKINTIPTILVTSLAPLWLNLLALSTILFICQLILGRLAAKREDEGRPLLLNATMVSFKDFLPIALRRAFFPTISVIVPFCRNYRS